MDGRYDSPTPPLLRLPQDIRRRIYRLVGLASRDKYPFNFDLHGPSVASLNLGNHTSTQHHGTFHGLLLSCRYIHAEAAALLYSHSYFFIYYSGPGSLRPLVALTAPALASLVSLKIVLAESSCHQLWCHYPGQTCCVYPEHSGPKTYPSYGCIAYHSHAVPLLASAPPGPDSRSKSFVDEWRAAMDHISSGITPGRLDLGLVCDLDARHERAMALATAILAPVRRLPLLKRCQIRLCRLPDARLSEAAKDTALSASGIKRPYVNPAPGRATLLALPRELRIRILQMTDLVTPSKEVWWDRHLAKYRWAALAGNSRCSDDFRRNCHFDECWHRPLNHNNVITGPRRMGCFCRRRHAAFTPFCKCWMPPGPGLFLICRAICEEARLVFFSSNRFVIHDFKQFAPWKLPDLQEFDMAANLWNPYPFERLAVSKFLREVVPTHCLAYLRFLELVFPPYGPPTWPQTDHRAMLDWQETIAWLRDKINGPVLTVRLVVADIDNDTPASYRITMTEAECNVIADGHMALMAPLQQLAEGPNGLARFYGDLSYPWRWSENEDDDTGLPGHDEWLREATMNGNKKSTS
ncbi:hypothetical protein C8A05DRAFT_18418 [Staphylotrichum tortipilum]|uniref:F-box domain-containing protein n=1 Tax=Staphylotrichum tortipilum TaxID=2831512 RepID=A0AAN6RQI5_9PEZI|nr:hypothetical protein C8A05DRAFT_18418 [Staphylotrichum longicolle]